MTQLATGGPSGRGFGFGATDEEALLSGRGEAVETLQAGRVIPTLPRLRGSLRALRDRDAVDPVSLCLPAGSPFTAEQELECVPARR